MIDYPAIAEKELFYIYILRYHFYSGNKTLQTTFGEFYEVETNIKSVLFPKKLAPCLADVKITDEEYIWNHSVMPFYQLFLKENTFKEICENILYSRKPYTLRLLQNQTLHYKIKSDRINYCPLCMQEDLSYNNIKRYQQIQGVYVCPKHHCYLNNIPIRPYRKLLQIHEWDLHVQYTVSGGILEQIAEDVIYILEQPPRFGIEGLRERLLDKAFDDKVFRYGKWNEQRNTRWINYYKEIPNEYAAFKKVASYKRYATDNIDCGINPMEYLMFIRSLFGSFENFVRKYN